MNQLCPHFQFAVELAALITCIILFSPTNQLFANRQKILEIRNYYLNLTSKFLIANGQQLIFTKIYAFLEQLEQMKAEHIKICEKFYNNMKNMDESMIKIYRTLAPISNDVFKGD